MLIFDDISGRGIAFATSPVVRQGITDLDNDRTVSDEFIRLVEDEVLKSLNVCREDLTRNMIELAEQEARALIAAYTELRSDIILCIDTRDIPGSDFEQCDYFKCKEDYDVTIRGLHGILLLLILWKRVQTYKAANQKDREDNTFQVMRETICAINGVILDAANRYPYGMEVHDLLSVKADIKSKLLFILNMSPVDDAKKYLDDVRDDFKPLSEKLFDYLREHHGIPFELVQLRSESGRYQFQHCPCPTKTDC